MNLQVGVKVLIRNNNDEYLFIRRSIVMEGEKQAHWDIPGGRIDPSEALLDALTREVMEETGLSLTGTPKLLAAQDIFVSVKDLHVVRLTYAAQSSGNIILSDEHEEYVWLKRDDVLKQNIDPYIKEVL